MPMAVRIGGRTVPFDDMTPAAWQRIGAATPSGSWAEVYLAPMKDLFGAQAIVEEAVRILEPDADAPTRAGELASSLGALEKLFVAVDDDLPTVVEDGNPPAGDETK